MRQLIYFPAMEEKIPLLIGLLRSFKSDRTMVFVNTRRQADRLEEVLRANHINAQALSGDVPQNKRLKYMKDFHSGALAVLIATDVASRGLHIPDVSHVFNYDLPQDRADYVHRIGRTARAGAEGDAISFACEDYAICLPDIEDYIGHQIPRGSVTQELLAKDVVFPQAQAARGLRPQRRGGGGRGGPRRPALRRRQSIAPARRSSRRWRTAPRPAARARLDSQSIRATTAATCAKPGGGARGGRLESGSVIAMTRADARGARGRQHLRVVVDEGACAPDRTARPGAAAARTRRAPSARRTDASCTSHPAAAGSRPSGP